MSDKNCIPAESGQNDQTAAPKRHTGRRTRRLILATLLLIAVGLFLAQPFVMGSGSQRYARKWSRRFEPLNSIEEAISVCPNIFTLEFPNGEWLFWVSADSHGNPFGGTIVTRDSRGDINAFFGHVCGGAALRGASLDEVYEYLSEYYEKANLSN
ncbi:MAG: hypothetical protein JSW23_10970 [Planctomycetota bacterium]|nr:MAG: hypothetical protein JSW23_10970 [Planctomycetota bacterium]